MNELVSPSPEDCRGSLHPAAREGVRLFNLGQYWKAHEALEKAWLEEPGQVRHLYRGMLQVGVAYFHITRGNYSGAVKVFLRSLRWLTPFPSFCRGIAVEQLRQDAAKVLQVVRRLGPEHIAQFDLELLKPVNLLEE